MIFDDLSFKHIVDGASPPYCNIEALSYLPLKKHTYCNTDSCILNVFLLLLLRLIIEEVSLFTETQGYILLSNKTLALVVYFTDLTIYLWNKVIKNP